ncbi:VOC family protein [Micromonospora fulviviridis]|uniref:VOC family protein n=1 Tax=Micromonospora fulviviridis TaxID=47860 RepID=A0ABV2VMV2_9ACTN
MTITQIRLITVSVSDQDRAKAFYADVLGLTVVQDLTMGPMRWLQVGPEKAATGIVLVPGRTGFGPGDLQGVQLETNDLDADCARLRAAGVAVDGPYDRPWGRDATFVDPDGNGYVLVTRESGG